MILNKVKIFVIIIFIFFPLGLFATMSSGNYQIISDSFNSGGGTVSSANYSALSAIGEIASGESSSTLYVLKAGTPAYKASPYVSISVDKDWIDLGILSTTATGYNSHTLDVASNAKSGYVLKVYGETLTNDGGNDIDEIGATATTSTAGTEQFGINLVSNSSPAVGATPDLRKGVIDSDYNTANNFAFINADTIMTSAKHSADFVTVSYIANISPITLAGAYQTTVTFTLSSNF